MNIFAEYTMGVTEVARELETSEQTVRNHCRAQRLHPVRLGPNKARYFNPKEVKQLALAIQVDRAWKRMLYRMEPRSQKPEPITMPTPAGRLVTVA